MATYRIESTGGAYVREGMRSAETNAEARATLAAAAAYLGYPDAVLDEEDGGDILAYESREDVDAAYASGSSTSAVLIAHAVES